MRSRWITGVAGLALMATMLSAQPVQAKAEAAVTKPKPTPVKEAADLRSATKAAAAQGSRVEVANLKEEDRVVYAEPNGTAVAELTAGPVRVKSGSGWTAIDNTLVKRADGTVGPKAASAGIAFSGGGTASMVQIAKGDKRITFTWPGSLPEPKLTGDTATYAEVRPGVDLVLKAENTGYTQHLVVKNAAAARALTSIRFGMTSEGVTVQADKAGALTARDAKGAVVFGAPPSAMWDAGKLRSVAKVATTSNALTLTPDQKLMRDPKAKFPITVDPNWNTWDKSYWTSVSENRPDSIYNNTSPGGSNVAQVGQCYNRNNECGTVRLMRSYFQFDTHAGGILVNKEILGVWLDTAVVHSPDCGVYRHSLWGTGPLVWDSTWRNAPKLNGSRISFVDAPASAGGCAGWKAVSFGLPTDHINKTSTSTYAIAAENEGLDLAWRKYDPAATKLRVRFNGPPNTPFDVRSDPVVPAACKWCAGTPYLSAGSIRLIAGLSDPDNNAVLPEWKFNVNDSEQSRFGSLQASGATHDTTFSPLADGQRINWNVRGWDTDDWNNNNRLHASAEVRGPNAPFIVDRTAPSSEPKVTGLLYKNENRWRGGAGVPGTFRIERTKKALPDKGTEDINHYLWGTTFPPQTKVEATGALGGPASFTWTPEKDGPQDIFVQSVDRAGNVSPTETYHVYVRPGNGPVAQWSLDGNVKDTAYLGDRHGELNGGATYVPGAVGNAVRLDGEHATSVTAPSGTPMDASYTVSAWVNLDRAPSAAPNTYTALSQDGKTVSGFYLGYRRLETGDRWEFFTTARDATDHGGAIVRSTVPARVKTWTHLTAVHDAQADQIRIYVNGVKAGTAPFVSEQPFDGQLRIGSSIWMNYVGANPWPGMVDEVKQYDRVLSDSEVRSLVGQDNVHAGRWSFDETEGETAANQVEGGESMVLQNGATFATGVVNNGVKLDGAKAFAATTTPAMATDQSFTVAAWVNATAKPTQADFQSAISADGNVNSAFNLGYRDLPTGAKWDLVVPSADAISRPPDAMIRSNVNAALNTPTHLAAVYDQPAGQIRLYVNGQLAGTAPRANGFDATGPLTVGRGKWQGAIVDQWTGVVDEVRAYSRELSESEIQGIVARSNVTAGTWKFDGDAKDSSGNNRHGTIQDGTWAAGQVNVPDQADRALRLNGSTTNVAIPKPFNPNQSFSATAWVKVSNANPGQSVLALDSIDNKLSAVNVHLSFDGKWVFAMRNCDASWACTETRTVGPAPQPGAWTHLAAVYDAAAGRITLFVNGVPSASAPYKHNSPHTGGKLQIGRATGWNNGDTVDPFGGAIDDVNVYTRVLFADEVRTLSGRDLTLIHNWTLDEPTGGVAADAVGARGGTITGARHVPGRLGNALDFDGTDDSVSTGGADVDTTKSFTVSAFVNLRTKCDRGTEQFCLQTAVSMDGGQPSKFRLGHLVDDGNNMFGAWIFEMPEADGNVIKASVSAIESDINRWVHLVGVYDPKAKMLWLYVNGNRQDEGSLDDAWSGTGGLQIGRGRVAGQAAQYWPGLVDDVRVYSGALDKSRIFNLFDGYPPLRVPAKLPTAAAGRWKFDEGSGTAVADASGRGLTATLKNGPAWGGGRALGGPRFDGVDDFAETAGPVVNTSDSFSVSAWVYLTGTTTLHRTILGQDGTSLSSFLLQYQDENKKWAVLVPGNPHTILNSTELAARDEWTHLTVVYEAGTQQLRLYVQGVLSAAMTGVSIPAAAGPFSIGRAKWTTGNADFFSGSIDEVRAFDKALNDDEVRKVHMDMPTTKLSMYKFDNASGQDYSWRNAPGTATGGASYGPGVFWAGNQGLHLDGKDGAMKTSIRTVVMADDFTVSAWAKLSHKNQIATVLAQDGDGATGRSGFVLQYRPSYGTWVFGGPVQGTVSAESQYAVAAKPAQVGQWTHLVGVYDHGEEQFRLYVNGELAGYRDHVTLPNANQGLTIGRAQYDGKPTGFFPGVIDEVLTEQGIATAADIEVRGSWPAPPADQQIGRYVNGLGEHYTGNTADPVRSGYHFEGILGRFVAEGPNTKLLYDCVSGTDYFTSDQADCEGKEVLGQLGRVYTTKPNNVPSEAIARCTTGTERYDSRVADCEGQPTERALGYTLAYGALGRYNSHDNVDWWTTVHGTPPSYTLSSQLGWLPQTPQSGSTPLMSCLDGTDEFTAADTACEGKTVVTRLGFIYTTPPADITTAPLYRCNANGGKFTTRASNCDGGWTMEKLLGHIPVAPPATTPTFP
ncbi:LamG domain-containing protein [Kribbella sp. NPDC056345]|uniref:LamG domain-containing protein n=1 Tax=Kribbella sp. NPDC056345 TaxID=3345789 RepID=UPI0035DF713F